MEFKDMEAFEDYGFELAKILHENRNKKGANFKKKNRKQKKQSINLNL